MQKITIRLLFFAVLASLSSFFAFGATTIDQTLIVLSSAGINGGQFKVNFEVTANNLPGNNTLGTATIDVLYDNTKLTFVSGSWNNVAGITLGNGYTRNITSNSTTVRISVLPTSVDGGNNAVGTDLIPTPIVWATLTFTIVNASQTTTLSIDPVTNQIGLYAQEGNGNGSGGVGSGVINNQTLNTPTNLINVPLPVELVNFTAMAQGRTVNLSWATKTESNNYGFDIERKAISNEQSTINSWAKVGFIEGKGTSTTVHNYSFSDVVKSAGTFSYRLKQTDRDGKFNYSPEVEAKATLTADDYKLSQNYPNPFNPSTKFNFAVKTTQQVAVKVFNGLGQEVVTLFDGVVPADQIQEVTFDGARLASGIYFYVLRAQNRVEVKKMLMVK